MTKIISIFNHKGGVSKTTTTFNLGWMLAELGKRVIMVDADPQSNLTGVALGMVEPPQPDISDDVQSALFSVRQEEKDEFFQHNTDKTLYGALRPAFESEPRLLEPVDCIEIPERPGLYVLPGHLQLGEYEVSLSIAQELSGSLVALKNIPGAFHYLIHQTAEALNVDYVLVDMSPSLGALNQNIVCSSDLLFVPTSPDFFSIMALRSLARILPRWNRWALAASENEVLRTATYAFPTPKLRYAGAVIQRYRLYRAPTQENPYGDPTGPFQQWINKVSDALRDNFAPALNSAGLLLSKEVYSEVGMGEDLVLGKIQEFNSLLPKSQDHRVPVFALRPDQLNQAGVVLDGSLRQIESLRVIFNDIADKIVQISAA
ncbi:ParA family protein [Streptomyces sp. enrichment culture]|uniref:ParA family protein n=1 Tax=Streptomyces sp. enrichment culture TaxID=1795815 RepID=UPI003F561E11